MTGLHALFPTAVGVGVVVVVLVVVLVRFLKGNIKVFDTPSKSFFQMGFVNKSQQAKKFCPRFSGKHGI